MGRVVAALVVVLVGIAGVPARAALTQGSGGVAAIQAVSPERVAGADRVTTTVAASVHGWTEAETAVIASAAGFADALAAGPLAASLDAPVLLTWPDVLPDAVAGELGRLGAGRVIVVGGAAAVSTDVAATLRQLPHEPTVTRIGGSDRFATAAAAAMAARSPGERVAVASGTDFPDALAAGALGVPLLLVEGDRVPAATAEALEELAPAEIMLVGGLGSVGSEVEAALADTAPTVTRVGADSRYETAAALFAAAAAGESGPLVAVTGDAYPDGLAAAALAARVDGRLLLVPSRRLTDGLDALVRQHARDLGGLVVVGGSAAVGDFAFSELAAALDGSPRPGFTGTSGPVPAEVRERMTGSSWRPGCPVGLDDLALLELDHWGFDGQVHDGQLVVAASVAEDVLGVFARLFDAGVPLERVVLVDEYGADDDASMAANNTSAFNCRTVAGTDRWSEHAYGLAVDVNPVQNPYVRGDPGADGSGADLQVDPPAGAAYLDRSDVRPGMAVRPGAMVEAFDAIGWGWGGDWQSAKDYQHFSATGR